MFKSYLVFLALLFTSVKSYCQEIYPTDSIVYKGEQNTFLDKLSSLAQGYRYLGQAGDLVLFSDKTFKYTGCSVYSGHYKKTEDKLYLNVEKIQAIEDFKKQDRNLPPIKEQKGLEKITEMRLEIIDEEHLRFIPEQKNVLGGSLKRIKKHR